MGSAKDRGGRDLEVHGLRGCSYPRKGVLVHIAIVGRAHGDRGHVLHVLHVDRDLGGGG